MFNKIALIFIIGTCLGQGQPFTSGANNGRRAFKNPMEIKQVVQACDVDRDGELSSAEVANCKEKNHQTLDINGDGRVAKHEIKQMVKMAHPETSNTREAYLAELQKFKDLMRDCNAENSDKVDKAKGQDCLAKHPEHKAVFEETDENHDGVLEKEEFRNEIARIRERMGVGSGQPTTPMNA